jgi:hypothetical protein
MALHGCAVMAMKRNVLFIQPLYYGLLSQKRRFSRRPHLPLLGFPFGKRVKPSSPHVVVSFLHPPSCCDNVIYRNRLGRATRVFPHHLSPLLLAREVVLARRRKLRPISHCDMFYTPAKERFQ